MVYISIINLAVAIAYNSYYYCRSRGCVVQVHRFDTDAICKCCSTYKTLWYCVMLDV
jgi:hypothetical protein